MADYNITEFNPNNSSLIWGKRSDYPRIYKTMEQAERFADPGSIHIVWLNWEKVES